MKANPNNCLMLLASIRSFVTNIGENQLSSTTIPSNNQPDVLTFFLQGITPCITEHPLYGVELQEKEEEEDEKTTKNNDNTNYLQEMKHTQYQQIVLDAKKCNYLTSHS